MNNVSSMVMPYHLITMTPYHVCSLGGIYFQPSTQPLTGTWPVANLAFFIPFRLPTVVVVTLMFAYNGAAVNGNLDLGIYDASGNRLISSGGVAQAGINQIQTLDIPDTKIGPGIFYMAIVLDNIVGTIFRQTPSTIYLRMMGIVQMANAYPLPLTAVFATMAQIHIPDFGFTIRGFV
jgi:hypothetical protein